MAANTRGSKKNAGNPTGSADVGGPTPSNTVTSQPQLESELTSGIEDPSHITPERISSHDISSESQRFCMAEQPSPQYVRDPMISILAAQVSEVTSTLQMLMAKLSFGSPRIDHQNSNQVQGTRPNAQPVQATSPDQQDRMSDLCKPSRSAFLSNQQDRTSDPCYHSRPAFLSNQMDQMSDPSNSSHSASLSNHDIHVSPDVPEMECPVRRRTTVEDPYLKLSSQAFIPINQIDPSIFDGEKSRARAWWREYDGTMNVNGFDDYQKARRISAYLSGDALKWYNVTKLINPYLDWSTLTSEYIKFFCEGDPTDNLHKKLEELRQTSDEDPALYLIRVADACLEYSPNISQDGILRRAIDGLQPYTYNLLALAKPREQWTFAWVSETFSRLKGDDRKSDPPPGPKEKPNKSPTSAHHQAPIKNLSDWECYNCDSKGHEIKDCLLPIDKAKIEARKLAYREEKLKNSDVAEQPREVNVCLRRNRQFQPHLTNNDFKKHHITLALNGTDVRGRIDSGSDLTILSAHVATSLRLKLLPWDEPQPVAIGKSRIKIIGMASVLAKFDGVSRPLLVAVVSSSALSSPLWGVDFLETFQVILNFSKTSVVARVSRGDVAPPQVSVSRSSSLSNQKDRTSDLPNTSHSASLSNHCQIQVSPSDVTGDEDPFSIFLLDFEDVFNDPECTNQWESTVNFEEPATGDGNITDVRETIIRRTQVNVAAPQPTSGRPPTMNEVNHRSNAHGTSAYSQRYDLFSLGDVSNQNRTYLELKSVASERRRRRIDTEKIPGMPKPKKRFALGPRQDHKSNYHLSWPARVEPGLKGKAV